MTADDSSLEPDQYRTVHEAALKLLNKGEAWGRFPTPVGDLMAAAKLKLAPISIFDEGAMEYYLRQAGEKAAGLLLKAKEKILGILDVHEDTVHIDPTLGQEKQTFLKLHETGHKEIPHQKGLYKWIQDCAKHLKPETADLFEREANTFASIVLFQNDTFGTITADSDFSIKVPLKYARKFGASAYAGIREYVRRSTKICAVVVLEPSELCPEVGLKAKVHRMELSADFRTRFGPLLLPAEITPDHVMMQMVPVGAKRMSWPVSFEMTDRNGQRHEFIGEGFKTPYNTFLLIHCQKTLGASALVLPPAWIGAKAAQ